MQSLKRLSQEERDDVLDEFEGRYSTLTVEEHYHWEDGPKHVKRYNYDWQYSRNKQWKWHNEEKTKNKGIIEKIEDTKPHHQHDESLHYKVYLPNYRHHDLIAVLESIRMGLRIIHEHKN
ncbi:DUF6516 family protein [Paenibacillus soyae]|uniref:DUF6516 family protein n=1 Tax=Paenibacillus soyae TaxID=2969249 RepID=UPI002149E20C|nr:DUF6516 family protein [Paenibacillus soyae]